jgi:DNA/RNA-binding domain of Phe-tRNA-synthetase-like protein
MTGFLIEDALFESFPGLGIGVVVATGVSNRGVGAKAAAFLKKQVECVRAAWSLERLGDDPRIAAWRDAYRAFGAKPKKHRSSVESSISPVVDVYNAISLQHGVPCGGDDLDRVIGDIRLTIASGDEWFVPLNGSEAVSPKPGEVIYRDDEDVLCRRWNWRECEKSKMTETSTNVCLVVECLPPITAEDVGRIASELAEAVEMYCGGRATMHVLNRGAPFVQLGDS